MPKSCFPDNILLPVLPSSFIFFIKNSIVKIHKCGSVFNSGRVPQVLGYFLIGSKFDKAPEALKPLGIVPAFATVSYFWLFPTLTWRKL